MQESNNNYQAEYVFLSFLIKYFIIIVSLISYSIFIELRIYLKRRNKIVSKSKNESNNKKEELYMDDGFDFIRKKDHLESKGDKLLKGEK